MKYIDVHSHLTEARFEDVREEIVREMKQQEIGTISIGTDYETSMHAVALARNNDHIWATIGQHPVDNKEEMFDVKKYQKLFEQNRDQVVAIGECGLDYYWPGKDLEAGKISSVDLEEEKMRQKDLFKKQIDVAVLCDIPLMLHVRSYEDGDAHHDSLAILEEKEHEHGKTLNANFHFFTEVPTVAQEIITRGYYVSFPGVITFADLDETIATVPLERMFSETDTPYAAPKPHRGKDATPLMVTEVVKKIAQVKELDVETARKKLLQNAQNFFNIQ